MKTFKKWLYEQNLIPKIEDNKLELCDTLSRTYFGSDAPICNELYFEYGEENPIIILLHSIYRTIEFNNLDGNFFFFLEKEGIHNCHIWKIHFTQKRNELYLLENCVNITKTLILYMPNSCIAKLAQNLIHGEFV